MEKSKNSNKANSKGDLLKYYKYVYKCKNKRCMRLYGSDFAESTDGLCPICEQSMMGKKNIFTRKSKDEDPLIKWNKRKHY